MKDRKLDRSLDPITRLSARIDDPGMFEAGGGGSTGTFLLLERKISVLTLLYSVV